MALSLVLFCALGPLMALDLRHSLDARAKAIE